MFNNNINLRKHFHFCTLIINITLLQLEQINELIQA